MKHSNRIDGKRQRVRTVLATTLMFVTAALLMVPFYFMFLSSLKPGTEMLRNGLSLTGPVLFHVPQLSETGHRDAAQRAEPDY